MKMRTDFVTNSSSSSFIVVSKIDKCQELIDYIKEEYGKYGLRLLDEYTVPGSEVKTNEYYEYEEFLDFCDDENLEIDDNALYLQALFIKWSTEGDSEGDDAWLFNHIPVEYMDDIYRGEAD